MNDHDFLLHFENATLPPAHFDHPGHIRLAWLYLSQYDLPTATQRICTAIKQYAESQGATDKFHLTLTIAFSQLIYTRMQTHPTTHWTAFLETNPDLLADAQQVLRRYYSDALLYTDVAKTTYQPPDLKPILSSFPPQTAQFTPN